MHAYLFCEACYLATKSRVRPEQEQQREQLAKLLQCYRRRQRQVLVMDKHHAWNGHMGMTAPHQHHYHTTGSCKSTALHTAQVRCMQQQQQQWQQPQKRQQQQQQQQHRRVRSTCSIVHRGPIRLGWNPEQPKPASAQLLLPAPAAAARAPSLHPAHQSDQQQHWEWTAKFQRLPQRISGSSVTGTELCQSELLWWDWNAAICNTCFYGTCCSPQALGTDLWSRATPKPPTLPPVYPTLSPYESPTLQRVH